MKAGIIFLANLTKKLWKLPNLKGDIFVMGGVLKKGYSFRDIDIMVSDKRDIPIIKRVLKPLSDKLTFLVGKNPKERFYFIIKSKGEKEKFNQTKESTVPHKKILRFLNKKK